MVDAESPVAPLVPKAGDSPSDRVTMDPPKVGRLVKKDQHQSGHIRKYNMMVSQDGDTPKAMVGLLLEMIQQGFRGPLF